MQKIVKSPCSVGQLQATRLQPHLQQPWQRTFATDEAVRRQRTTLIAATDSEKEASQERFLDVSDILRDVPEDLIFEDEEEGDIWDHEARFIRQTDGEAQQPVADVVGALDPNQADILSAYSTEQGFKEVDVHYLAYNMQDNPEIEIIDVRTPEEYASGHIAGTTNVSLDSLSEAVRNGSLKPGKAMAVVCARGGRSAQACVRLTKVFGFPDVTNVTGGMQAWTAADLPVVRD